MKNKKILLIVSIALLAIIMCILLFKYIAAKNAPYSFLRVHFISVENKRDRVALTDKLDKDTYSDKILNNDDLDRVLTLQFLSDTGEEKHYFIVYLDDDRLIYVKDPLTDKTEKVSSIKMKSMYSNGAIAFDGVYLYAIGEDGKLYKIVVDKDNLEESHLLEIVTDYKITNFVNISFDNDMSPSGNTVFVLSEDGNIYEAYSDIRYDSKIKLLFDSILVYSDNTIASVDGYMFEDKKGNYYKIKYIFKAKANDIADFDSLIIITEDNRLLFTSMEFDLASVAEANLKVKDIKFAGKLPFTKDKLTFVLEDDHEISFDEAWCSSYYCVNEFN